MNTVVRHKFVENWWYTKTKSFLGFDLRQCCFTCVLDNADVMDYLEINRCDFSVQSHIKSKNNSNDRSRNEEHGIELYIHNVNI